MINPVCKHLLLYVLLLLNVQTFATGGKSESTIRHLADEIAQAALKRDLKAQLALYHEQVISMPEYQPTLNGKTEVEKYYREIYKRQTVKKYKQTINEILDLGELVFEIGEFNKTILWQDVENKNQEYRGKYLRIWEKQDSGRYLLYAETEGFFERLDVAKSWLVDPTTQEHPSPRGFTPDDAPIELQAYVALGVKGVLKHNGELRAKLYTDDAVIFPYADTAKRGKKVIKPYLIDYAKTYGELDWLNVYTHDYRAVGNYLVEFSKFVVGWTYDGKPGRATGKNINLWQRQENGQLLVHRQFGTHNL